MLINDFRNNSKKFNSINNYLKENYGVSIKDNLSTNAASKVLESINKTYMHCKHDKLLGADSAELSKLLLMKEALCDYVNNARINENLNKPESYNMVVSALCSYVCGCIELGDEFSEAVDAAMREYRSSKYRFPDDQIRAAVENSVYENQGNIDISPEIFDLESAIMPTDHITGV